MMTFVKWNCGCIGVKNHSSTDPKGFVIEGCDGNDSNWYFGHRPQGEKDFKTLSDPDVVKLLSRIGHLVEEGERLGIIKRLLK